MKSFLLCLAAAVFPLALMAQGEAAIVQSHSATMKSDANITGSGFHRLSADELKRLSAGPYSHKLDKRFARTTAVTSYNEWYALWDANYVSGTSAGYYMEIYPDSNLFNGTNYIRFNGAGMSFDPTDSGYALPPLGTALTAGVTYPMAPTGQIYTLDSFYAPVRYMRNNPLSTVVDSVVIEIVVTPTTGLVADSGAYNLIKGADWSYYNTSYDLTPRFGTIHYNNGLTAPYNVSPYINDCYFDSVFTRKYRYVLPLTNANKYDTSGNGCILLNQAAHLPALPLSPAITIYSTATHVVSYVSFKSGVAYPLGTSTSSANHLRLYAGEPNGSGTRFRQSTSNTGISYPGSFQTGVYAVKDMRYDSYSYTFNGHNVLAPSFDLIYTVSVPFGGWHVKWTCNTPTVSAITGSASTVCVGGSITLSDATPGGVWSVKTGAAVVGGGSVFGSHAGVDTIVYTVTNSCGPERVIRAVTVNPLPDAGFVSGVSVLCKGSSVTLTASGTPGGVWSASNSNATVAGGVVSGVNVGSVDISYTVTNMCGSDYAVKSMAVALAPDAGAITGPTSVCLGSTIALTNTVSGGTWSSTTGNATLSGTSVFGAAVGTDVINYKATTACGSATSSTTITVNPLPVPSITVSGTTLGTTVPFDTYQWRYGGVAIAGGSGSTYAANVNGEFSVTVTDANGCEGTSTSVMVLNVGIDEINAFYNLSIYPNPATTVIYMNARYPVNAKLMSVDGRLVREVRKGYQMNIADLADGVYILSVYETFGNARMRTERIQKVTGK